MSEQTAYQTLRKHITLPGDRIDRIENLIGAGFPDTNCCINGIEFWIEIKAPSEPKRATTPLFGSNHKVSTEQRNWFLRQRRAKGLGFIYIETDSNRLLIDGEHADIVNLSTLARLRELSVWCAPRPTPPDYWHDLREFLAHHG